MDAENDLDGKKGERTRLRVLALVVICVGAVVIISGLAIKIGVQTAEMNRLRLQFNEQKPCGNNCQFDQPFNDTTCTCMCEDGFSGELCQFPPKGGIGQVCTASNDCIVQGSECRTHEGKCGCIVGYSFQSSTQTCETDCVDYGDTFQSFNGHGLKDNNGRTHTYVSTPEECIQLCRMESEFVCRSCDYRNDGRCDLAAVDASDFSSKFYMDWPDIIYYQRNCV